jgi:Cof subfamily protein (haloacid dehalogenase superfamily)
MDIKLVVTDLDGTLLPEGTHVPKPNVDAVKAAAAQGVTVTIATGRMFAAALPIARQLSVDVPIITYNGSLIKSVKGEVYDEHFLPEDVIGDIVEFCEAREWHVQSYADDQLYFAEHDVFARRYEAQQGVKGLTEGWPGLRKITKKVSKMLIIGSTAEQTEARIKELRDAFGDRVEVMRSNAQFAEIVCPGVSKASALKTLAEKLGIGMENVLAIGDSNNDLPMLQTAGHSVAMGNAVPEVRNSCEFTVASCDENGFAEAIEKYVLKD